MSNTVKLYGGVTYHAFGIDEGSYSQDESFKQSFTDIKSGAYPWKPSTKLLANFNNTLSGSNYDGDFGNVNRFQIYKTIGGEKTLHKVCETKTAAQRIIEDFTIGDLCDYQYYVYPICKNTISINDNDIEVETISPIILEPVRIHNGIVSVIGLIQDKDDKNTYYIDENNVWQLALNVSNDGYTLNTDKTFYKTQNAYGKMSGGNLKQRSIPISGLLGKIDCSSSEYVDTFDHIIDWENFAASNSMKMLIDLRGIITLGDINVDPSFAYENTPNHEVSVTFTFIQLNSINNVDVLGRHLLINPIHYQLLKENQDSLLQDTMLADTNDEYNEYIASPLNEVIE